MTYNYWAKYHSWFSYGIRGTNYSDHRETGRKLLSVLLGFAGGVMTAVVVFDLIPSALVYGNLIVATLGFLAGLCLMLILDVIISEFPALQKQGSATNSSTVLHTGQQKQFLKMGYLIAIGIALHDLPEGIAIAVGYAAKENLGLIIALAIGMHNVPEGIVVPLLNYGSDSKI